RPAGSARPGSLRPPLHVALVSAAFSRALARPVLAVCRALRRRRRLLAVLVAGVLAAGALPAATPVSAAEPVAGGIVFQAEVRATGESAIFSAASDGSAVRRLTPSDGRDYHWPRWAFGDRKIVYTSRPADSLEPATRLEIMNADGSGPRVISSFDFAVGQPRVDATGDWLFFTGAPPWFPDHAIFRMDLRTLESINLTGVTSPIGGLDADPALSPDGTSLYLVSGSVDHADVTQMSVDGRTRRPVTRDMYWNTDPDVSPDGRTLAISSYRGPETPSQGGLVARPNDFHLVLHDLASGTERVMTAGAACVTRTPAAPCSVPEMSAYAPRFTLDGRDVGFTGALDRTTTCICAIGVDGSNARAIISSTVLAISWFDFSRADGADGEGAIGSEQRSSRLLVTMASGEGVAPVLVDGSPDLMHRTELPLPEGLDPLQARWSPDRSRIAFTARATVPGVARSPHPAAPAGAVRREHVTLADLDPVTYATRSLDPPGSAEEQVFLREADGSVRALTDPWVEDWQDGVRSGDARANTDPVFTADGRAVIVTNTSTLTGESFLLRIDLATGSVLNLTNATSGALPVDDRTSALSPDGRRVAFAWTNGAFTDIYTMGTDGSDVREVTTTDAPDSQPTWLPDGSGIVSVSERSSGPALVRTRLGTGRETVLTPPGAPVSRPVAAPEGDRVLYLGQTVTNLSVFGVGLQGGAATFVLQPDPLHQHLDLDWR
ncbi:MAG: Component of the Tol biopolymer transport system, partial [Blastococcus sp.]|nr:Component of the Tol biopolymer transport system [Blastococcus sp.]